MSKRQKQTPHGPTKIPKVKAQRPRKPRAADTSAMDTVSDREPLTNVDGIRVAPPRVRPSYHPVLHAYIRLIDDGRPPTCVNLARELGITKQAVSQMFQRHPDLLEWIGRRCAAAAGHYAWAILRRHAFLGIQGSVAGAALYLKAAGPLGFMHEPLPGVEDNSQPSVIYNFLVPRPEYPQGALTTPTRALIPRPDLPKQVQPRPDIPTLEL